MARRDRTVKPENLKVDPEKHARLKAIGVQKGEPSRNPAGRPPREEWAKEKIWKAAPEILDAMIDQAINGKNEASKVSAQDKLLRYIISQAPQEQKIEHNLGPSFGDFLSRVGERHNIIEASYEDVTPALQEPSKH